MLDSIEQAIVDTAKTYDIVNFFQAMLLISAGLFIAGIALRILCGRGSSLSKAVIAFMTILIIYVITVAYNIENHYQVIMAPLPFISLSGDCLTIMDLAGKGLSKVCIELVNMMVLAFAANIIEEFMPPYNKGVLKAFFLRLVAVFLTMVVYSLLTYGLAMFLPDVIVNYAPVILVIIALVMLLATVFKLIVGVVLGLTVSPIIGAIYTFFIETLIGKKLFKAFVTTFIMLILVYICNVAGYTEILLSAAALATQIPTMIMIVVVWILFFLFI